MATAGVPGTVCSEVFFAATDRASHNLAIRTSRVLAIALALHQIGLVEAAS